MRRKYKRGFTLIEVMIAVVIVAILTAVALPAYMEHLAKSRRAEGRNALLRAAQLQERFYTTRTPTAADGIRYAQTDGAKDFPTLFGLGTGATVYSSDDPSATTGYYTLTVAGATASCPIASCFVITATPNPATAHKTDPKCGNLSYTSSGERRKTGTESVDYCWGK